VFGDVPQIAPECWKISLAENVGFETVELEFVFLPV